MTADPLRPRMSDGNRAPLQALAHETARCLDLDPFDEPEVLDLAAVAIARLAWRDSPVEDWHAAPNNRISNAELMRATASITRHVRELLGVDPRSPRAPTPEQLRASTRRPGSALPLVGRTAKGRRSTP